MTRRCVRTTYLLEAAALHEGSEAVAVPGIGVGAISQQEVEEGCVEWVDQVDL